jgi:hypothetical protein
MKIANWLRNQAAGLLMSVANVQKDSLGQDGTNATQRTSSTEQKQSAKTLLEALIKGEMNKEVRDTRYRMYKVEQAAKHLKATASNFESEDFNYKDVTLTRVNSWDALKKVKTDTSDSYPLEIVIYNGDSTLSFNEVKEKMIDVESTIINEKDDDNKEEIEKSIFTVGDVNSLIKANNNIIVARDEVPQFFIEDYTKKIMIKKISDTKKLIEFYVSKYPIEEAKNSKLFINEIIKIINGKRSNITALTELGFLTYNAVGVNDYLEYQFTIDEFKNIVEFDGSYVFKFFGTTVVDGFNVIDKYKEEDLDEKYKNKEARKHTV